MVIIKPVNMKYTEKVSEGIRAVIEPFHGELLKAVSALVLESFKNGIEVGKGRKDGTDRKPREGNSEEG